MQATVQDAMTTDVVAAPRHTSIADAEQMLVTNHIEELFVVDSGGLLCGVVPDYELLKWRMSPCSAQKTIESVMSRRFLVIGADSSLTVAARYLREHIHRRLAVVEERRLIGQITRHKVLAWLTSLDGTTLSVAESDDSTDEEPQRLSDIDASMTPRRPPSRPTMSVLSVPRVSLAAHID